MARPHPASRCPDPREAEPPTPLQTQNVRKADPSTGYAGSGYAARHTPFVLLPLASTSRACSQRMSRSPGSFGAASGTRTTSFSCSPNPMPTEPTECHPDVKDRVRAEADCLPLRLGFREDPRIARLPARCRPDHPSGRHAGVTGRRWDPFSLEFLSRFDSMPVCRHPIHIPGPSRTCCPFRTWLRPRDGHHRLPLVPSRFRRRRSKEKD